MEKKKLIVLGNGFDLACGLNSSYKAFFEKRISDELTDTLKAAYNGFTSNFHSLDINDTHVYFDTILNIKQKHIDKHKQQVTPRSYEGIVSIRIEPEFIRVVKKSKLTFWDIVLFYFQEKSNEELEDVQWRDVEARMLDFLADEKTGKPSLKRIKDTVTKGNALDELNWFCLHLGSLLSGDEQYKNLTDYLYQQLRLFESAFVDFLNQEIEGNNIYKEKAADLLFDITSDSSLIDLSKHKFLSFNYTRPFFHPHVEIDITNVHGTLGSKNIIFGIDQEKIDAETDIYRFTKTFRQMTETEISKRNGELILPKKEEIEEISFFGHSLSRLDYSYFQTLFDFYDLYSSDVKLAFYYKTYGEYDSLAMELDLSEKISKMLRTYGPSISNEKKANNLMHKLLLEKRLIIEEIR